MAAKNTQGGDGFDVVFGSAIEKAVRLAMDTVGRDPLAELDAAINGSAHAEPEPEPPATTEPAEREALSLPPPLSDGSDPYELLGVSRSASWEEIAAAHHRRARSWHPDGADPAEAERRHELLRQLNAAYAELRIRRGR